MSIQPPKWVDRLLETVLGERFVDEVIGDLHEWHAWKSDSVSGIKLQISYMREVLLSLKLFRIKKLKTLFIELIDIMMINNNVKLSIRSLIQNRVFTGINLLGLTASLLAFLLIFAYVSYELSYDDFHSKKASIYRVLQYSPQDGSLDASTQTPVAQAFLNQHEGDIQFARYGQDPVFIDVGESSFYEENFYWGDSSLFTVLDLPFLYGDPRSALKDKNTVVLTEEISVKYFGEGVNPVGKLLPVKVYDSNVELLARVDGVMLTLPSNTDLPFEILGSLVTGLDLYSQFNQSWGFSWLTTFAYIPNSDNVARIKTSIPDIIRSALGDEFIDRVSFEFQPLKEVHLQSTRISHSSTNGNLTYITTFIVIGFFIILIASINYLNLTSARIGKRQLEAGVRKVMGASKKQLIVQFLTESYLTLLLSFVLSLILAVVIWPLFTDFVSKSIPLNVILNWQAMGISIAIVIASASLSGIYPALTLSRVSVAQSLNGHQNQRRRNRLQKVLVTLQFAISVFLIISALVIYKQISFVTTKDLGFNGDQLVSIKVEERGLQGKILALKEEMRKSASVLNITTSSESLPSQMNNGSSFYWDDESKEINQTVNVVNIDKDFFPALGIEFLAGKNFINKSDSLRNDRIILNRAAQELMGVENVEGTNITLDESDYLVIGVVENYHYRSLKSDVQPTLFIQSSYGSRLNLDNIIVRLSGSDIHNSIASLERVWKIFTEDEYFSFHFVDQAFEKVYTTDKQFLKLFTFFALLSIIISCIGLYGMVLFTTEDKSKEISIRKVLGSSVGQIVLLLSSKFVVLITLGFIAGIPAAIIFCNNWLEQFSYKIDISLFTLVISGIIVLFVSVCTMGIHTIKAALINPTINLRR